MGDPLSVTASVAGILTIAAQSIDIIINVTRRVKNAPDSCRKTVMEISDLQTVMSQLQLFVLGTMKPSRSRTSLIMADQMVATLASCVQTFSELDMFARLLKIDCDKGLFDRLHWVSKEGQIQQLIGKLQMHKSTLSLMLHILTCQRQEEAEEKVDHLQQLVEEILDQNRMIAYRLGIRVPQLIQDKNNDKNADPVNTLKARIEEEEHQTLHISVEAAITFILPFDIILRDSKVYQRVHTQSTQPPDRTASTCTGLWSATSGLSLGDISNISVLSLPLLSCETSNPGAYISDESAQRLSTAIKKYEDERQEKMREDFLTLMEKMSWDNPDQPDYGPPNVFGAPLVLSISRSSCPVIFEASHPFGVYCNIPWLVAKIGVFIKHQGVSAKDIFVRQGNPRRVANLSMMFNLSGRPGCGLPWTGFTVYDAADVLLSFLDSLPDPVVPTACLDKLVIACLDQSDGGFLTSWSGKPPVMKEVWNALTSLPRSNRLLFLYLIDLLETFNQHCQANGMPSHRLAYRFRSLILPRAGRKPLATQNAFASAALEFLIENHSRLHGFDSDLGVTIDPRKVAVAVDSELRKADCRMERLLKNT